VQVDALRQDAGREEHPLEQVAAGEDGGDAEEPRRALVLRPGEEERRGETDHQRHVGDEVGEAGQEPEDEAERHPRSTRPVASITARMPAMVSWPRTKEETATSSSCARSTTTAR